MDLSLAQHGYRRQDLPPSVLDAMRWKWRRALMDRGGTAELWRAALHSIPKRLEVAGRRPKGGAIEPAAAGLAPYAAGKLSVFSKRRQDDSGRMLRRLADARARKRSPRAPTQEPPNQTPASKALAMHDEALASVLVNLGSEGDRLRLALAYDQLISGQTDHWAWLDALGAVRGR
jgi:hypothetical protein